MEYLQLRTLNIFSDEEIVKIKNTREDFDLKISQPSRAVKDYVHYILYERDLLSKVKERSEQEKVVTNHTVLTQIVERIKKLYSDGVLKFPKYHPFWIEYIKFLTKFKSKDVRSTYDTMLKYHSDKVDVWIKSIEWDMKDGNYDMDQVQKKILNAKMLHPNSLELNQKIFEIELENKCQQKEHEALRRAKNVYSNCREKYKNFDAYWQYLDIADKFNHAETLQDTILNDIRMSFSNNEKFWNKYAQRKLKGTPMGNNKTKCSIKDENSENNCEDLIVSMKRLEIKPPPQAVLKEHIKEAIKTYEEAVATLNTQKMWNYYIKDMVDLNEDLTNLKEFKQNALLKAYEAASESDQLSEDHYFQYIVLLCELNRYNENIENVCLKATKTYGNSSKLWLLLLRYYISTRNPPPHVTKDPSFDKNAHRTAVFHLVNDTFEKAKNSVGTSGIELWEEYLYYINSMVMTCADPEFKKYVSALITHREKEFIKYKVQFLNYVADANGIIEDRNVYRLLIEKDRSTYEIHDMMATLESIRVSRSPSERDVMDEFVKNFNRIDVWVRYKILEVDMYLYDQLTPQQKTLKQKEKEEIIKQMKEQNVAKLKLRALEALPKKLHAEFNVEWDKIKVE